MSFWISDLITFPFWIFDRKWMFYLRNVERSPSWYYKRHLYTVSLGVVPRMGALRCYCVITYSVKYCSFATKDSVTRNSSVHWQSNHWADINCITACHGPDNEAGCRFVMHADRWQQDDRLPSPHHQSQTNNSWRGTYVPPSHTRSLLTHIHRCPHLSSFQTSSTMLFVHEHIFSKLNYTYVSVEYVSRWTWNNRSGQVRYGGIRRSCASPRPTRDGIPSGHRPGRRQARHAHTWNRTPHGAINRHKACGRPSVITTLNEWSLWQELRLKPSCISGIDHTVDGTPHIGVSRAEPGEIWNCHRQDKTVGFTTRWVLDSTRQTRWFHDEAYPFVSRQDKTVGFTRKKSLASRDKLVGSMIKHTT